MKIFSFFTLTISLFLISKIFGQNNKPFITAANNNIYSLLDADGNILHDGFTAIYNNNIIVAYKHDSIFVLNNNYDIIFKGKYDRISYNSNNNLFIVNKNNKYGVVDINNKIIIPSIYDYIENVNNEFLVKKDKLYGIIDIKGKINIPIQYDKISYPFKTSKPLLVTTTKNKNNLVNKKNKILYKDFPYNTINYANSNFLIVGKNNGYYLISPKTYKPILGPFELIQYKSNNENDFIVAQENNKYLIFNSKTLAQIGEYDWFDLYNNSSTNSIHTITLNKKVGFLNNQGILFIPPQYDESSGFNDNVAPVLKDGKWGIINTTNNLIIPYQFIGHITSFKNGVAKYSKGPTSKFGYTWHQDGLINTKGEIIAEPIYYNIEYLEGNKAIIKEGDNEYLYDFVTKQKIKQLGETVQRYGVSSSSGE